MNQISPNDVKKGAIVHFTDGRIGEVMDNRRGMYRCVKVEVYGMPGLHDVGDDYVFLWNTVEQDGEVFRIVLSPALQKQANEIIRSISGYYF